ncbi:MAG: tetratricopeptide repeat protein, partial [Caldilineales bacterium]|nr:tetratricopeptide repeat protein [Caldilineales bacterium]
RWAYAWLAYCAQQDFLSQEEVRVETQDESGESDDYPTDAIYNLAESYLLAGDPSTALTILFRWHHHSQDETVVALEKLAVVLDNCDYCQWALLILDRILALLPPEEESKRSRIQEWKNGIEDELQEEHRVWPSPAPETTALFHELLNIIEHPLAEGPRYLPPLDGIAATGDVGEGEAAAIVAHGRELAPDLIHMAFNPLLAGGPAPDTAVSLLRRLWQSGVVELDALAGFLETATPGWQRRLLNLFGKIGPVSLEQLTAIVTDPALALNVRLRAIETLEEYARKVPEERPAVLALVRDVITAPVAQSPAEEEDLVAFAINTALDLDARELLPVIQAAFREDRVSPWIISPQDVETRWQLSISEETPQGNQILLICKKCHRYRYFAVKNVVIDLNSLEKEMNGEPVRYSPFIMDREIICPKCGARDQYDLEPLFRTALLDENLRRFPVTLVRGYAFKQPMHPLEAIERYKMRILTHPRRAENYLRLGNLLRFLHRSEQALAMTRKGHELEPDHVEWTLMRAMAEHDLGDRNSARQYYKKVIQLAEQARNQGADVTWFMLLANKSLENLSRGEPSAWFDIYREELSPDEITPLDFDNP